MDIFSLYKKKKSIFFLVFFIHLENEGISQEFEHHRRHQMSFIDFFSSTNRKKNNHVKIALRLRNMYVPLVSRFIDEVYDKT